MSTPTSQDDHTILLPDGRVLGYAEYGSPTGSPLLFFHGFPTSRLEAWGLDRPARLRRVRVIAADRPGFGLSTFQPHRRITDWPSDVQALAQHLGLSRFAVLGGSGGSPYALACAHSLPRETLSAEGVMAGAGPWESGIQDGPWSAWLTYLAATYCPAALRLATDALVGTLRRALSTGPATRWLDSWLNSIKREGADAEEARPVEERREKMLRIGFEGFAQGAAGFVHEAQLLTQDWGFKFQDVEYNKIQMWHGAEDKQSPLRMARYMADRLPHCVLRVYEGETHWTMGTHLDEIISAMIPESE